MRNIVKNILYVLFVIIVIATVIFIACELILANHIIPAIVIIVIVGALTGYFLAKHK